MKVYTIPNSAKSTDTATPILKSEAVWIKKNMAPINLDLVGWLETVNPADLIACVTQDLREGSGVTQATRTRLRQMQLIRTAADPMALEISLQRWRLTPLFQEHLDATKKNVLGSDNFIQVQLDRTGTVWSIAPLYFNIFCKKLINLQPTALRQPKQPKLTALKPSRSIRLRQS